MDIQTLRYIFDAYFFVFVILAGVYGLIVDGRWLKLKGEERVWKIVKVLDILCIVVGVVAFIGVRIF
ncbi:hypothetical protein CLPU_2c02350 [Gottschalkia purinilytica]|uniref:Uncharacterized protein n=1 Tax=Gottschalkia purinilytica TaxID=1503 RepID=A0A0L0WE77_GOTPU|nr:CLC_0170 family protein [Gottschalkia purinilytica]KNF09783.1 hypothetical protein CLPU_2c02350 [Gottschalkia purinilytica]